MKIEVIVLCVIFTNSVLGLGNGTTNLADRSDLWLSGYGLCKGDISRVVSRRFLDIGPKGTYHCKTKGNNTCTEPSLSCFCGIKPLEPFFACENCSNCKPALKPRLTEKRQNVEPPTEVCPDGGIQVSNQGTRIYVSPDGAVVRCIGLEEHSSVKSGSTQWCEINPTDPSMVVIVSFTTCPLFVERFINPQFTSCDPLAGYVCCPKSYWICWLAHSNVLWYLVWATTLFWCVGWWCSPIVLGIRGIGWVGGHLSQGIRRLFGHTRARAHSIPVAMRRTRIVPLYLLLLFATGAFACDATIPVVGVSRVCDPDTGKCKVIGSATFLLPGSFSTVCIVLSEKGVPYQSFKLSMQEISFIPRLVSVYSTAALATSFEYSYHCEDAAGSNCFGQCPTDPLIWDSYASQACKSLPNRLTGCLAGDGGWSNGCFFPDACLYYCMGYGPYAEQLMIPFAGLWNVQKVTGWNSKASLKITAGNKTSVRGVSGDLIVVDGIGFQLDSLSHPDLSLSPGAAIMSKGSCTSQAGCTKAVVVSAVSDAKNPKHKSIGEVQYLSSGEHFIDKAGLVITNFGNKLSATMNMMAVAECIEPICSQRIGSLSLFNDGNGLRFSESIPQAVRLTMAFDDYEFSMEQSILRVAIIGDPLVEGCIGEVGSSYVEISFHIIGGSGSAMVTIQSVGGSCGALRVDSTSISPLRIPCTLTEEVGKLLINISSVTLLDSYQVGSEADWDLPSCMPTQQGPVPVLLLWFSKSSNWGLVAGVAGGIILLVLVAWYFLRHRSKKMKKK